MHDQYYPAPPPAPPAKRRGGRRWLTITGVGLAAAAVLITGVGIGAAGGTETDRTPTDEPAPAPADACLEALEAADELLVLAAEYPPMIADAAEAGYHSDSAALDEVTGRMEEVTDQVETIDYTGPRDHCRNGGER